MPVSLAEHRGHAAAELGMRVDARADRRAAGGQFEHGFDGPLGPLDRQLATAGRSRRISWPSRSGVASARCVRPILMILSHCLAFSASTSCKPLERGDQIAAGSPWPTATWIAVGNMSLVLCPMLTWSLGWIGLSGREAVAAEQLDRPVGDHLVGVHVARRARAGLKHVDRKLVVELAVGHFAGRGEQGFDLAFAQRVLAGAGQLAEIAIGHRRGVLHQAHAHESAPAAAASRRWEILHRRAAFAAP